MTDLGLYTDAVAMRDRLQRLLPGFADRTLRIERLHVRQARRNASRHRNPSPMTLCYALDVRDTVGGRTGTQVLCAQVFREMSADAPHRGEHRTRLVAPAFGPAMAVLPELGMVVWALPNDPALPQLRTLLDPARVATALPWRALGVARADVAAIDAELFRYEPQRRATLRCTLRRHGGAPALTLFGKTFCDEQARALQDRFAHVWRLRAPDAPRVARPLGWCAATRTFWQAAAQGVPLAEALDGAHGAALAARVARALAHLHAAPLALASTEEPHSVAHWLQEARRRQTKIGRADPALAGRVARIADAIEARAPRHRARPLGLVHADFHPEQVWCDGARIVLFDFDEFALGDPMEDVAAFVLKLGHAGRPPALREAFVAAYADAAPARHDRAALGWHLAVQSLVQACRAFVFQRPGWAAELARRLAASEAHAARLDQEPLP